MYEYVMLARPNHLIFLRHHCEQNRLQKKKKERDISERVRYYSVLYEFCTFVVKIYRIKEHRGIRDNFFFNQILL